MYEKSYQAWKEFKEKLYGKSKEQFEDATPEEKRALLDKMNASDDEQIQQKEIELNELFSKMQDLTQEIARLTEYSTGHQVRIIQHATSALNNFVRNGIPDMFHFPREDMDKIIRAIEQDRRTQAQRETLEGMPYDAYLKTEAWQIRRSQALKDAKNRCQLCYSTKLLNVHHKTYERRGHELPEDLIVLCNDCHAKHHDKIGKKNSWNF
jgi:hypothetical protein